MSINSKQLLLFKSQENISNFLQKHRLIQDLDENAEKIINSLSTCFANLSTNLQDVQLEVQGKLYSLGMRNEMLKRMELVWTIVLVECAHSACN